MKTTTALLAVMLPTTQLLAQNPVASPTEAPRTNAPPRRDSALVSPEVHSDRTVTFRLRAASAKEVKVSGEWPGGATSLTKDDNGVWSGTVGPLEPDVFGYSLVVDGLNIVDPS